MSAKSILLDAGTPHTVTAAERLQHDSASQSRNMSGSVPASDASAPEAFSAHGHNEESDDSGNALVTQRSCFVHFSINVAIGISLVFNLAEILFRFAPIFFSYDLLTVTVYVNSISAFVILLHGICSFKLIRDRSKQYIDLKQYNIFQKHISNMSLLFMACAHIAVWTGFYIFSDDYIYFRDRNIFSYICQFLNCGLITYYFIYDLEWGHQHRALRYILFLQYLGDLLTIIILPVLGKNYNYYLFSEFIEDICGEFGLVIFFYGFRQAYITFVFRVFDQITNQIIFKDILPCTRRLSLSLPLQRATVQAQLQPHGANPAHEKAIVLKVENSWFILVIMGVAILFVFDVAAVTASDKRPECWVNYLVSSLILIPATGYVLVKQMLKWERCGCWVLLQTVLRRALEHWALVLVLIMATIANIGGIGSYYKCLDYHVNHHKWAICVITRWAVGIFVDCVHTFVVISKVHRNDVNSDNDMAIKVIGVAQFYLLLHAFVMDAHHLSEFSDQGDEDAPKCLEEVSDDNIWVNLDSLFAWAKFELHLATLERIHF